MSNTTHDQSVSDIRKYSIEQFDKNIVFIASGALAVSFAFIKDIIPNLKEAICKEYLIYSWHIFAGVIFISLMGHFISMQGSNWAIANANLDDEQYNKGVKRWSIPIRALNIIMIVAIFIGAILLISFIHKNLS